MPISYVGTSTFTSGTGALSVPAVTGVQAGDFVLLLVESANEAVTTPAGFTIVPNSPVSTGTAGAAGAVRLSAFYQFATGADSITSVADSGDHTTAAKLVFRGVYQTNPFINAPVSDIKAVASTTATWPSITTTIPNSWIVLASALDNDANSTATTGAATNANLTSITERVDATSNSLTGGGLVAITAIDAVPGAIGATTATVTSTIQVYLTIALAADDEILKNLIGSSTSIALATSTFVGSSLQTSSSVSLSTAAATFTGMVSASGTFAGLGLSAASILAAVRAAGASNGISGAGSSTYLGAQKELMLNFNEAPGSTPVNSGASEYTLTGYALDAPLAQIVDTETKFSNVLDLNTSNTAFRFTVYPPLTSSFAAKMFMKITDYNVESGATKNICVVASSSNKVQFYINTSTNKIGVYASWSGFTEYTASTEYIQSLLNSWHYYELNWSNNIARIFIDGVLLTTRDLGSAGGTFASVKFLRINGYDEFTSTGQFTGFVDAVEFTANQNVATTSYTPPTTEPGAYVIEQTPNITGIYRSPGLALGLATGTSTLNASSRQGGASVSIAAATSGLSGVSKQTGFIEVTNPNSVTSILRGILNSISQASGAAAASSLLTATSQQQATASSVATLAGALGGIARYTSTATSTSNGIGSAYALALQSGLANGSSIASSFISKIARFIGNGASIADLVGALRANSSQIASSLSASLATATHNGIARYNGAAASVSTSSSGLTGLYPAAGSMVSASLIASAIRAAAAYTGSSIATSAATTDFRATANQAGSTISYSVVGGLLNATARYAATSSSTSTASSTLFGRAGFIGYADGATNLSGAFGFVAGLTATSRGYSYAYAFHNALTALLGSINSSSAASTILRGTAKYVGDADAFATASTVLRGWAFQRGVVLSESDVEAIFKAYAGHVGSAAGVGRGSTDIRGTSRQVGTSSVESFALSALRGFAAQEGTTIAQAISMGVGAASATAKALNSTVVNVTAYSLDTYVSYSGTALVNTASIALVDGSSLARVSDTTVIESINTDIYNGLVVATPGAITVIDGARVLVPFGYVFGRATIDKVSQSTIPGYGDITISTLPSSTIRTRPTDADQLRIIRQKADPTPKKSIVS